MRMVAAIVIPALLASGLTVLPTVTVPKAAADCTSSGGTTICSQGDVRGANTGQGPGSGPSVPYPCDLDWYCFDNDWTVGIDIDPDPGWDIGRPGRPGNRPNAGGGRGGGGGRR
jgi:hypothetical protein